MPSSNAVEFVLEAVVGLEIESAAQELVEGGVEILLGGFEVAGAIVVLACLVFLFYAGDQVAYGIGLAASAASLGHRGGCCGLLRVRIWRVGGRDQGWGLSRRGRHEGSRFLRTLAGESGRQWGGEQRSPGTSEKKASYFQKLSPTASGRNPPVRSRIPRLMMMVLSQNSLGQRYRRHLTSLL